jgi:hypothetical protein
MDVSAAMLRMRRRLMFMLTLGEKFDWTGLNGEEDQ